MNTRERQILKEQMQSHNNNQNIADSILAALPQSCRIAIGVSSEGLHFYSASQRDSEILNRVLAVKGLESGT